MKKKYKSFRNQAIECNKNGDRVIIKGYCDGCRITVCLKYKDYCHNKACLKERM